MTQQESKKLSKASTKLRDAKYQPNPSTTLSSINPHPSQLHINDPLVPHHSWHILESPPSLPKLCPSTSQLPKVRQKNVMNSGYSHLQQMNTHAPLGKPASRVASNTRWKTVHSYSTASIETMARWNYTTQSSTNLMTRISLPIWSTSPHTVSSKRQRKKKWTI